MEPFVCIILVSYNTYGDTVECVSSLLNIEYSNFKIIIVDNNSNDANRLKADKFLNKNCDIILSNKNGGFSAGNNIGIEFAKKYSPQYYLLLNNDTTVKESFLSQMVQLATEKESDCGLVSGRICYYSDQEKINYRGGKYDRQSGFASYLNSEIIPGRGQDITFATGCLWLIPFSTIEMVGLLDETYFMYSEDVEYCCRIIDNGLKIYYCDDAIIYHKISASSGGENSVFTQYYIIRNELLNIKRFGTRKQYAYFLHLQRYIKDIIKRRKNIKYVLYAWYDFIYGKVGKSDRFL